MNADGSHPRRADERRRHRWRTRVAPPRPAISDPRTPAPSVASSPDHKQATAPRAERVRSPIARLALAPDEQQASGVRPGRRLRSARSIGSLAATDAARQVRAHPRVDEAPSRCAPSCRSCRDGSSAPTPRATQGPDEYIDARSTIAPRRGESVRVGPGPRQPRRPGGGPWPFGGRAPSPPPRGARPALGGRVAPRATTRRGRLCAPPPLPEGTLGLRPSRPFAVRNLETGLDDGPRPPPGVPPRPTRRRSRSGLSAGRARIASVPPQTRSAWSCARHGQETHTVPARGARSPTGGSRPATTGSSRRPTRPPRHRSAWCLRTTVPRRPLPI